MNRQALDAYAQGLDDAVLEAIDIGKPRQIAQCHRLFGQKGAGNECERGILRAGNRNGAGKTIAAAYE